MRKADFVVSRAPFLWVALSQTSEREGWPSYNGQQTQVCPCCPCELGKSVSSAPLWGCTLWFFLVLLFWGSTKNVFRLFGGAAELSSQMCLLSAHRVLSLLLQECRSFYLMTHLQDQHMYSLCPSPAFVFYIAASSCQCVPGQVTFLLWASVSSSVKWG